MPPPPPWGDIGSTGLEASAAAAAAAVAAATSGAAPNVDGSTENGVYGSTENGVYGEKGAKTAAHLHPHKHPFTELPPAPDGADGIREGAVSQSPGCEDLGAHVPVVRLRGLPFSASEQD